MPLLWWLHCTCIYFSSVLMWRPDLWLALNLTFFVIPVKLNNNQAKTASQSGEAFSRSFLMGHLNNMPEEVRLFFIRHVFVKKKRSSNISNHSFGQMFLLSHKEFINSMFKKLSLLIQILSNIFSRFFPRFFLIFWSRWPKALRRKRRQNGIKLEERGRENGKLRHK